MTNPFAAHQQAFEDLLKSNDITEAYLFGSHARGEARPDSDIDLLVRFSKRKSLLDHAHVKTLLDDLMGRPIDLIEINSLSKYVQPYVDQDKVKIYG